MLTEVCVRCIVLLNPQVLVVRGVARIQSSADGQDVSDTVFVQDEFALACDKITQPNMVSNLIQMIDCVRTASHF